MTTPRKLINGALRLIGAQASGESPGASDAQDAIDALNMMLGSWSTTQLLVPCITETRYYAHSPRIELDPRPMRVVGAYGRWPRHIDFPIEVIGREDYHAIPLKTLRARPRVLWWDQEYPFSSIHLYPVPDRSYAIFLQTWERLPKFRSIDQHIELPGEYFEALQYNLAVRLAPLWSTSASQEVVAIAKATQDALARYHATVPRMTSDLAPRGSRWNRGHFDWRTGQ